MPDMPAVATAADPMDDLLGPTPTTSAVPAGEPNPVQPAAPFVWQHGIRLLLLDEEFPIWMLAELEFDHGACRYVELRRAAYNWEREATGALLSRALSFGQEAAEDAASKMDCWLRTAIHQYPHPQSPAPADHSVNAD